MNEATPLHAQCPVCRTVFRVTASQLAMAEGRCRCGLCGHIFDARAAATHAGEQAAAELADGSSPAADDPAGSDGPDEFEPRYDDPRRREPVLGEADFEDTLLAEPDFDAPAAGRERRQWPWWLAITALLVALLLQIAWFQREAILADERLRGWLTAACEIAGCEVGLPTRPAQVEVVERSLTRVSGDGPRLRFRARVVNRAGTPIAWPQLRLRLRALNGTVVAERSFAPREYLRAPVPEAGMPTGEPVAVGIEMVEGAKRAEGFEVAFH